MASFATASKSQDSSAKTESSNDAKPQNMPVHMNYPQPWNSMVEPYSTNLDGETPSKSYWKDIGHEAGLWKIRGKNYLKDKVKFLQLVRAWPSLQWSGRITPKLLLSTSQRSLMATLPLLEQTALKVSLYARHQLYGAVGGKFCHILCAP